MLQRLQESSRCSLKAILLGRMASVEYMQEKLKEFWLHKLHHDDQCLCP